MKFNMLITHDDGSEAHAVVPDHLAVAIGRAGDRMADDATIIRIDLRDSDAPDWPVVVTIINARD